MSQLKSVDPGGVVENTPPSNLLCLRVLPNTGEDKKWFQLVKVTPVQINEPSLISQGIQLSTTTPAKFDIGLEKPAPSENVQTKTEVPEEKKKVIRCKKLGSKSLKRLTVDSSTAARPREEVKEIECSTAQAYEVHKVEDTAEDNCKDAVIQVKDFIQIHDKPAPPRALAVLPKELQYRRGHVMPRRSLPAPVRFGPVQGINETITPTEAHERVLIMPGLPVFMRTCDDDNSVTHINVDDQDKSNWICLLPLGDEKTANVWLYECGNEVYGATLWPIPAATPLRLGYNKEYAEKYGIIGEPTIDIFRDFPYDTLSYECNRCPLSFPSDLRLRMHINKEHIKKGHPRTPRGFGRHRCKLCKMRFTRMFTLRRHQLVACTKIKAKEDDNVSRADPKDLTDLERSETQNDTQASADDDNRLPSDESLQNYTNILDISTNLFDTDRMPNLDISGSVKSDNDFNPLGFKDDSHLANDFSFANGLMDDLVVGDTPTVKKSPARKLRSSSPFSCPYCKINMPRSKIKQHSKTCMAQCFVCVCGRKYRLKVKMEAHIRVCDVVKNSIVLDNPYSCGECSLLFKRRGMYVNHLTARHPGAAAAPEPPLVVPDRRFPCPSCSKLYKTQAKRHSHVLNRHPGLKYNHSIVLVCGSKTRPPAKCWACPKQYCTRSKLLQHARRHHPGTEPPAHHAPSLKKARQRSAKEDGSNIIT